MRNNIILNILTAAFMLTVVLESFAGSQNRSTNSFFLNEASQWYFSNVKLRITYKQAVLQSDYYAKGLLKEGKFTAIYNKYFVNQITKNNKGNERMSLFYVINGSISGSVNFPENFDLQLSAKNNWSGAVIMLLQLAGAVAGGP